eukprot:scaffold27553_cov35-Prasinocladus_malaysianus.AAC.1
MPPDTDFGSKFTFEPDQGVLAPGEMQSIRVKLLSDILGPFNEVFFWNIKGSATDLSLQFRGRVAGPEFEFSPDAVDFGLVGFGFRYTQEFTLANVSEIPFDFRLRVPQDSVNSPEFQMLPSAGRILPGRRLTVAVELCSETVRKYDGFGVVLDVPGVGDELATLPILAECCVPKLGIVNRVIDFGRCYLRYPYKQVLTVTNDSKLPARFEVLPQDDKSAVLAQYKATPASAGIPAQGDHSIEFDLNAERLGRLQLPVRIKTVGSRMAPIDVTIECLAVGPSLLFRVEGHDDPVDDMKESAAVDFGKVQVLEDHSVVLTVYNPTLIAAEVKAFVEGKESMFEVDKRELTVEPGETTTLKVIVNVDEVQPFKDVLHVMVAEGADNCVPLTAVGVGSTVVCEELTTVIDDGNQFTNRAFSKQFVLRNEGRRAHSLVWLNQALEAETLRKAERQKAEKKKGADQLPKWVDREIVWNVDPPRLSIPGKSQATVTITGFCTKPGEVEERLTCTSVPSSGKGGKVVFDSTFKASVAAPLLEFSMDSMRFEYWYVKGVEAARQTKALGITNVTQLPLTFTLSAPKPFTVDRPDWTLQPGESCDVQVGLLSTVQLHAFIDS